MNRSFSVVKNTVWEMGYYVIVIALGFLAPRFIILYYGSEVNGLTTTVQQIINTILILQSGAATAAVYSLYKPIAKNNVEEVLHNIEAAEAFFRKISFIFLCLMVVVTSITPFVLNTSIEWFFIVLAMTIMGTKSFADLFFTAKYRIVFTAYQQKYYISIATLIEQIVYYALVFLTIFSHLHYIFIYLWFLVGCIVKIVCLKLMLKKTHPDLVIIPKTGARRAIGDKNYALANELSHTIMASSVTVMMSFMYGLAVASVYSVYALVSEALNLIMTSVYSAFAPSFGNLNAHGDNERTASVFSTFQFIYLMFSTFLMMCMLFAIVPFVRIYTSGATDINYVNYSLATVLSISGSFSAYRVPYNIIVSSCGYFKETWIQPVITVIICVGLSFGLGAINYSLVLVGPAVFYATNFIYQHYRLKRYVPYLINDNVFLLFIISGFGIIITIILNIFFVFPNGILSWVIYSFFFAVFSIAYILFSSLLLARKKLLASYRYIVSLFKTRFVRKSV